jgi:hypothetical protein
MKRIIVFAMWLIASIAGLSEAMAQDCLVKQAADAAVQRQIAMLDAAKVNPSEFFSGQNSCISPMLLQKIDLSKFIPSMQDFLSSGAQSMINNLIQQAQAQVCQILNQQLSNLIGRINSAGSSFQSQLGSQLAGLLGGQNAFSPVQLPGIGGIGQYNFVSQVGGSLFGGAQPAPLTPGSQMAPAQGAAPNFGGVLR